MPCASRITKPIAIASNATNMKATIKKRKCFFQYTHNI